MVKCPKCMENIESLNYVSTAHVYGFLAADGEECYAHDEHEEVSQTYFCPKCKKKLFHDWSFAENFLKGK